MDRIFRCISECFHSSHPEYKALEKKDDDWGMEEAKQWLEDHPVNEKLHDFECTKIKKYAQEIITSLKKVPVNSSNVEMIAERLHKMAEHSDRFRKVLLKNISKINTDEKSRFLLKGRLICTYSYRV